MAAEPVTPLAVIPSWLRDSADDGHWVKVVEAVRAGQIQPGYRIEGHDYGECVQCDANTLAEEIEDGWIHLPRS